MPIQLQRVSRSATTRDSEVAYNIDFKRDTMGVSPNRHQPENHNFISGHAYFVYCVQRTKYQQVGEYKQKKEPAQS